MLIFFNLFKANVALWKRYNGYKPFMYNITLDLCFFLNNQNSNPVLKYLYDSFSNYSNINHCPLTVSIPLYVPDDILNDLI